MRFEDRFRLYVDESGDHVFRETNEPPHRFLCLLGCWFQNPAYLRWHEALEDFKAHLLPHHPDEPVIRHREDILNARRAFSCLRDHAKRAQFDDELLRIVGAADCRLVAVVIDKQALRNSYGDAAAHPYHLGLGFLLQRFAGYLNHISRMGDVMAESRGGKEDRLLKESYARIYQRGAWMTGAHVFRAALTSGELKLKPKAANVAGLQLADLLGHPVKQWVLKQKGLLDEELGPFANRLLQVVDVKFNRHLYSHRLEGYGWVLYPRK